MTKNEIKLRSIIREIALNKKSLIREGEEQDAHVAGQHKYIELPDRLVGSAFYAATITGDADPNTILVEGARIQDEALKKTQVTFNKRVAKHVADIKEEYKANNNEHSGFMPQEALTQELNNRLRADAEEMSVLLAEEFVNASVGEFSMVPKPTFKNLMVTFVAEGVKMFMFGFVDNYLLVLAGNLIENMVRLDIPFLPEGLGNTFSDAVGDIVGGEIETFANKMGFEVLTEEQRALLSEPAKAFLGSATFIGVVLGCLAGWAAGVATLVSVKQFAIPTLIALGLLKASSTPAEVAAATRAVTAAQAALDTAAAARAAIAGAKLTASGTAAVVVGTAAIVGFAAFKGYHYAVFLKTMSSASQTAFNNALSRVMSGLGIYTEGHLGKVTNLDLVAFDKRINDDKESVEKVWRDEMNPIKIAGGYKPGSSRTEFNNPNLDMGKLIELIATASKEHGLASPILNEAIINESRWQKLAGII